MGFSAIDAAEWGCCLFCIVLQSIHFRVIRRRPWTEAFTAGVAVLPSAVVAAYAFSRFLSWDESYIFYDIVNYYGGRLHQWESGAFRCTITLLGPLLRSIEVLFSVTKDVVLILAKALHWCMGAVLVTLITDQAHRYLFPKVSFRLFHVITFNCLMLLPVTGLALKTLNYDLLSMLPGVLGCIWCIAGLHPLNKRLLFAGMLTLTCASHEKLIASPLLWVSLVGIPIRVAIEKKGSFRTIAAVTAKWTLYAMSSSFLMVAASFTVVFLTHGPNVPPLNADQITTCWMASLWPLLRLFGIAVVPMTTNEPMMRMIVETALRMGGIVVVVFLIAIVVGSIVRRLNHICFSSRLIRSCRQCLPYVRVSLIVLIVVTGVIAGYTMRTSIWPLVPVAQGNYVPTMTFNGIAHHFGSRSLFTHTLASIAWTCTVFINALPTPVLALMVAAGVLRARCEKMNVAAGTIRADLLFCLFTFAPLIYGAIQIPLFPRYFNLFLAGSVVTGCGILDLIVYKRHLHIAVLSATAGIVLTVAEIFPFKPLGAAFRPVWSNYSHAFNNDPGFGLVTPWYPGWGEELFDAYKILEKRYRKGNVPVVLYHNFPASLIGVPPEVRYSAMPVGHGMIPYSYGENDYYIISRNGVSSYPYIPFPEGVPVLFTIADRGFVKVWVFRGSDLNAAGFYFLPNDRLQ